MGIDAQELLHLQHYAGMDAWEVLAGATYEAAKNLMLSESGEIKQGAIADLIAVKGNLSCNLKILEYPDLVMTGGAVVVDNYVPALPVKETGAKAAYFHKP